MHNEYGLTWLDSVDVEAMSPTQVSRWTMYARYGFMELRIKEAVWRFESVYASIFDTPNHTLPTSLDHRCSSDVSSCPHIRASMKAGRLAVDHHRYYLLQTEDPRLSNSLDEGYCYVPLLCSCQQIPNLCGLTIVIGKGIWVFTLMERV